MIDLKAIADRLNEEFGKDFGRKIPKDENWPELEYRDKAGEYEGIYLCDLLLVGVNRHSDPTDTDRTIIREMRKQVASIAHAISRLEFFLERQENVDRAVRKVEDDQEAYHEWRHEVSAIAIKSYNDPYGQDPTSKVYCESELREMYEAGKTPKQVWA